MTCDINPFPSHFAGKLSGLPALPRKVCAGSRLFAEVLLVSRQLYPLQPHWLAKELLGRSDDGSQVLLFAFRSLD